MQQQQPAVDPLVQQLQMQREGTQQFLDQFGQGQRDRLAVQAAGAFNEAMRNQPIQTRLQDTLMQRLGQQGQPDAMTQAELTRFGQQRGEAQEQLKAQLQQLGLLTEGGDTAEQLAKFTGQSLLGEQQIMAQGQQRGERAFQDALGLLQQRQGGRMSEAQMRQMEQQAGQAEGQLGLQAFGQAQQGALGQQRLGLQERGQMLQEELGRGRLGLETELGRGRLGVQERGVGVQERGQELQEELGRGRLGLETELGRGRLGLQQEQFGEGRRQFDVGQGFREEMGRGQLGLQREQFGEGRRQFDVGQGLRERQFGEGQRQFDAGQGLRERQFGEGQRQFDVGTGERTRQFGEGQRQFDVGQQSRERQLDISQNIQEGNLDLARNKLTEETRRWDTNLERADTAARTARRDKQYGGAFKVAESLGFFDNVKEKGLMNTLGGIPGLGFLGGGGGGGQQQGGGGGQQQGGGGGGWGNIASAILSGGGGGGGMSAGDAAQFQTLVNLGNDPAAVAKQMGLPGIPGEGGGGAGGLAGLGGLGALLSRNLPGGLGGLGGLVRGGLPGGLGGVAGNVAQTALGMIPGGGTVLGGLKMARKLPGAKKVGGFLKKGLGKIFSDEDLKDHITPINEDRLLAALTETPVNSWQYKGDDKTHIGPMAQDFARFGTDTNEGGVRTIDVVDAFGVNFAANKALATKIKQHQKEIQQIRKPQHDWFN